MKRVKSVSPGHAARPAPSGRIERWLSQVWWSGAPGVAARLLWPLSLLYRAAAGATCRLARPPAPTPVPVIVVGNLVVGGAGKTPVVIALVQALKAAGRRPGVISRGHGRQDAGGSGDRGDSATGRTTSEARGDGRRDTSGGPSSDAKGAMKPATQGAAILAVTLSSAVTEVGDEPLLICRRTGVPVFVGRRRAAVASALCAAHPQVDVIVSDDGLQHQALARAAEVIVFDDRGAGNGLLLPAGPLREPLPAALPAGTFVVYSGRRASTALPGVFAPRTAAQVVPLRAWSAGETSPARSAEPLTALRGRRITALAGIGAPDQFFAMLEAAGLVIERLPHRDHAPYPGPPWPPGTSEVITTEKDAVKLAVLPDLDAQVWVLPLDCTLPDALVRELLARLPPRPEESVR